MVKAQRKLSGWGNYPVVSSDISRPERHRDLDLQSEKIIARGFGRSYGDGSVNGNHHVVLMERLNRFLAFDDQQGILRVEAGVSLKEILDVFVPRGWFLPVTPGTKDASIGGCVVCDVHGKNHHVNGSIGAHTLEIELLLADGSRRRCSPAKEMELFWATVGGMGLTGIVTEVALKLIPIETASMMVRYQAGTDLDAVLNLFASGEGEDQYSTAWIDCLAKGKNLGRSIVMTAHHAVVDELPANEENPLILPRRRQWSVPFRCPSLLLNSRLIKMWNSFYFSNQSNKKEPFLLDYDRYFYFLDGIGSWNRLYGKKGCVQYQFVLPDHHVREGLKEILEELTQSQRGSFFGVLKRLGKEGQGYLSFPKEGYTLAVDLPITDEGIFPFLDRLDELVLRFEGRVYLAKDARMKASFFREMYPRLQQWQNVKRRVDPNNRFNSNLARRLEMGGVR